VKTVDSFVHLQQVGYANSTAIQKLQNYGKHYFVLVHGTADENVHFQVFLLASKSSFYHTRTAFMSNLLTDFIVAKGLSFKIMLIKNQ